MGLGSTRLIRGGDLLRDLARNAPQGLPLGGDQGGSIRRRACQGLPESAAANEGFAVARFDAPQHVDIRALAVDGVQLLEIEHELEISVETLGVARQGGDTA